MEFIDTLLRHNTPQHVERTNCLSREMTPSDCVGASDVYSPRIQPQWIGSWPRLVQNNIRESLMLCITVKIDGHPKWAAFIFEYLEFWFALYYGLTAGIFTNTHTVSLSSQDENDYKTIRHARLSTWLKGGIRNPSIGFSEWKVIVHGPFNPGTPHAISNFAKSTRKPAYTGMYSVHFYKPPFSSFITHDEKAVWIVEILAWVAVSIQCHWRILNSIADREVSTWYDVTHQSAFLVSHSISFK